MERSWSIRQRESHLVTTLESHRQWPQHLHLLELQVCAIFEPPRSHARELQKKSERIKWHRLSTARSGSKLSGDSEGIRSGHNA